MKRLFKLFFLFVLPLSLAGCNGNNSANKSTLTVAKVTLNAAAISLDPGENVQLTAKALDKAGNELKDATFKFHSSNPSVATVSADGFVIALKKGYSTITAISETQIGKCVINVGGVEEELVALSFSPEEVTVKLGATYRANLVTYPAGLEGLSYNWYSTDESVAVVEDGNIIGKKVGSTTIKVVYGKIEAEMKVNVSENSGSAFTISLNRESLSLYTEGEPFQLVATCSEEATVTWESTNSGVASVDRNGLVTPNAKGSVSIRATANGVTVSCSVIVSDGSAPEETNLVVYFYIDYNNIETPYGFNDGLQWYTGVPFGLNNMPATPTTAPDPAFPNFMGWSSHTIIDDTSLLWNFETDVVPEGTYTFVLYGIWFD